MRHGSRPISLAAGAIAVISLAQVATLLTVPDGTATEVVPFVRRFRLAYTDPVKAVAEADDFDLFVLNADAAESALAIKAANPVAHVLVYKNLAFAADWDPSGISHGVGWDEASTHGSWFLTDDQGGRIESEVFPGNFVMDVGNADYRRAWLSNVRRAIAAGPWDGVFVDDVNWRSDFAGTAPAAYDDAAWRSAVTGMIEAAAGPLRAAGSRVVLNIGAGYAQPGLWEEWLALADGAMEEHFAVFDEGPLADESPNAWRAQLRQVEAAQRLHKIVMVQPGGDDPDASLYAYATFLLVAARGSYVSAAGPDPGTPLGPAEQLLPGVFRRRFENVTVVVNATRREQRVDGSRLAPTSATIDPAP